MLTKEEAEQIVKPYYSDILECIEPAWQDYKMLFQEYQHRFEIRTRACIVRDLVVDNVRKKFFGKSNPYIIENPNGLFLLSIDDKVFARFKKIKTDFTTSNIATQQALQFANDELFPDYFKKALVNIGYMVDKNWDKQGAYICCPNGENSYEWYLDLNEEININKNEVIDLAFNDNEDIDEINEIKRIMNPKKEKETNIQIVNLKK